jgi:flagellar biogenesis protein FliO
LIVRENDLSCYLVNSSGDIFLLLMIIGFFKLVVYLIVRFFLKKKEKAVQEVSISKRVADEKKEIAKREARK